MHDFISLVFFRSRGRSPCFLGHRVSEILWPNIMESMQHLCDGMPTDSLRIISDLVEKSHCRQTRRYIHSAPDARVHRLQNDPADPHCLLFLEFARCSLRHTGRSLAGLDPVLALDSRI